MLHYQPWLILLIVAIGNCGFWLFWFNRVNAAGFPRRATKRAEKLLVFVCFAIPAVIFGLEYTAILSWLQTPRWWPSAAPLLQGWGAWCVASVLVLGALWLESRLWLLPPQHLRSTVTEYHRIDRELAGRSTGDRTTKFLSMLPGNQICDLEVTRKELELPRPIPGLDGFKLGHLSDLHFTGQYSLEHYHRVLDRFMELEPDLIVLTGDIIDYPEYIEWIEPLLGRLVAPLGCTYLLGNHDLRLPSIEPMLTAMNKLGHFDIGIQDQTLWHSEVSIQLTGNERPWFERHPVQRCDLEPQPSPDNAQSDEPTVVRIGLSHTPDQIAWARRRKLDLLLAGHTHGGQFRFPGVGPIVSPSMHGSKFASGVFYLHPTLMHVSRGVAGTHPLRWWCPPEVSLLTLRSKPK